MVFLRVIKLPEYLQDYNDEHNILTYLAKIDIEIEYLIFVHSLTNFTSKR